MIKIINLFLIAFSLNVHATVVTNMNFEATQSCPVYQSKNQQSNPDNLMVEPNKTYPVREINKASPDWFRIELAEHHAVRWVSSSCGFAKQTREDLSSCDNADTADSYVLAISSQPGFCETYGYEAGKPECRKLSKDSYQARHLTLHGLWPNKDSCGQHYGYCGVMPKSNHCDYAPISLSSGVSTDLKRLMPSYYYGSCLERHEWNKHGSCQILTTDNYFSLAMRLLTEADQSVFGQYLTDHQGQTVKRSTLRSLIASAFGAKNEGKIYLGCKNGILVDVFIQLPALIPLNEPLTTLISKAPDNQHRDLCSQNVIISQFTKDSWL